MPWGDCTGPWWLPGRGYRAPGFWNPWCRARWFWRGFGVAGYPYAPFREPTPDEEVRYLEDVAADLEEELKAIRERLERLRSTK
ncbi:DUF5320 domain-containing protein [Methanothrix sp.]|uniref:DUF5320 domain-containing protein n=1 Tax=Methanothrix sp. TaxID=90426 RepID=UPI003C755E54